MNIFLTGGTGYLGGAIARELLAAGHKLRLLYRSPERLPGTHPGVLPVRGDLMRPESLRDAIDGVDAICHSAAMVKSWVGDEAAMHAINVTAIDALCALAQELSVPKLVYTSSFMALGPSGERPTTESTPTEREHFHNLYERTKYLGDQAARAAQARSVPVVILYPTVIFGPGALTDGNHVGKIVRDFLHRKIPGRVGRGDALWNYVSVDDVAIAHRLAIENLEAPARFIIGGENVSMDGFLDLLEELSGVPAPTRRIPPTLARVLAAMMEWKCRLLGGEPDLTREVLEIYERDWAYSGGAAQQALGFEATPLRAALARTIEWARSGVDPGREP